MAASAGNANSTGLVAHAARQLGTSADLAIADAGAAYVRELQALLKEQQDSVRERNRQIEEGVFQTMTDPRRPQKAPTMEEVAPAINFAPLENAANALTRAADRYKKALDAAKGTLSPQTIAAVNARLIQSERQLTAADGLPPRPWYRHLLYAPGLYTGYGVKTMPAAREAIEQRAWSEAEREMGRIAEALNRAAAHISSIAEALEGR